MSGYRENRFWSPMLGCNAARLSMADARGDEYFVIVPTDGTGSQWRARRGETLSVIMDAIDRGDGPGEVVMDEETAR